MKYALAISLLLGLAMLAIACDFNARISEKEAARYAEKNRELFDALPIPPGAELVRERDNDCAGAFKHDKQLACVLRREFETTEPLINVMTFYDEYFAAQGWNFGNIDSQLSESYSDGPFYVGLGLLPPLSSLQSCPDGAFDPEGEERCVAREVRRNDGKPRTFRISISPD